MEVDEGQNSKSSMLETLQHIFSTSNTAKRLLSCRASCEEEQWAERAIDALIKRLKKKRGALDDLEYALANPNCPSKCVTIPRGVDGRLQISSRKCKSYVIYCKLWRWADLRSHHELRALDCCKYAYPESLHEVCINPYHYKRVTMPNPPAVMITNEILNKATSILFNWGHDMKPMMPQNVSYPFSVNQRNLESSRQLRNHDSLGNILPPQNLQNLNTALSPQNQQSCSNGLPLENQHIFSHVVASGHQQSFSNNGNNSSRLPLENQQTFTHALASGYQQSFSNNGNISRSNNPQFFSNAPTPGNQNMISNTCNILNSEGPQNVCRSPLLQENQQIYNNPVPSINQQTLSNELPSYDHESLIEMAMKCLADDTCDLSTMESYPLNSSMFSLHEDSSSNASSTCSPEPTILDSFKQNLQDSTPIVYEEPQYWGSIAYYELNARVGDIFHCRHPIIIVDGYTDPVDSTDRFCLGRFTHVNRNSIIEHMRRHIGRGVQLHYTNGELYADCNSDCTIFVQSRNCNTQSGLHSTTVIKIPPGYELKIFDNNYFGEMLKKSVLQGFEAVYELTKMCTIRMSFVKGWGAEYQRQDVTATPCWIEIHLHGPLKWLDNVLTGMGAPQNIISSVS